MPDPYLTRDRGALMVATRDEGIDDLLRRALDWLARVAPYDLATVLGLEEDKLVVRAARGTLASARIRDHEIDLADFPTIREALETRRARAYTEDDHKNGDGDPFEGVLDLPPGHSCMIVPLCAGDSVFGVATLERSACEGYPPDVVELVEVYGQVIATAMESAKQTQALRLGNQERERARRLQGELGGELARLLEQSTSPAMVALVARARQVAATATPVLLLGETGTGKERLARALHAWSDRSEGPFVTLNCAESPTALLESELFGHEEGAFTGAARARGGRLSMANGGTLLLDEIHELPLALQAKLLRVLSEGRFEPVGSDQTVKVDVRVLSATHVDLEQAVAERRFREDLYYRLNVFPLRLVPLRERPEDLPLACEVLLDGIARRTGRRLRVDGLGLEKLRRHGWPGNLRELGNVLERAVIMCDAEALGPDVLELPRSASPAPARRPGSVATLDEVQRQHITHVLGLTGGKIYGADGAARLLGLKPSTLQSRMKKLGIARRVFVAEA